MVCKGLCVLYETKPMSGHAIDLDIFKKCTECGGTGIVCREYGLDKEYRRIYDGRIYETKCPTCKGIGSVDK